MKIHGISYGKSFIEIENKKVKNFLESGWFDKIAATYAVAYALSIPIAILIRGLLFGDPGFKHAYGVFLKYFTLPGGIVFIILLLITPNCSTEISPGYLEWRDKDEK